MEDLFGTGLRATVLYLFALLVLRLAGKRAIASLTPFDLLIALVMGEAFDDVIWGDVPLARGLVAVGTLLVMHGLVGFAASRSQRLHQLFASRPTPVISHGRLLPAGLAQERTRTGAVKMELRLLQEDSLAEIKAGQWEPDGQLSVEKFFHAKPLQKRDLTGKDPPA